MQDPTGDSRTNAFEKTPWWDPIYHCRGDPQRMLKSLTSIGGSVGFTDIHRRRMLPNYHPPCRLCTLHYGIPIHYNGWQCLSRIDTLMPSNQNHLPPLLPHPTLHLLKYQRTHKIRATLKPRSVEISTINMTTAVMGFRTWHFSSNQ